MELNCDVCLIHKPRPNLHVGPRRRRSTMEGGTRKPVVRSGLYGMDIHGGQCRFEFVTFEEQLVLQRTQNALLRHSSVHLSPHIRVLVLCAPPARTCEMSFSRPHPKAWTPCCAFSTFLQWATARVKKTLLITYFQYSFKRNRLYRKPRNSATRD